MLDVIILVLDSTLRLSTPLLFACLAGLFSERSGIVDIGLEGKMLGGAFAAGAVAYWTQDPWLGLLAAIFVSVLLALIHGFASITNRGNQVVAGVAINFLAAGLTVLLGQAWFAQGGRTPQLDMDWRFSPITLPFAESIQNVPFIGPIYADLLSGHNILVYAAFVAVPLTWWVVFRTRFGLRLRAVGESPQAVDTAGISVAWLRYRAVIICGALCGFAGAYLAIAQSAGFIKDMSAGKGFIALAALIFAKWKPVNAMFACLLFGFLDAVANLMQGQSIPGVGEVPVQFFQALPYILTVVLLAGFIGRAIPPKASGIPYVKERT
ncbi:MULTISPECIES: ABC transporter permease [Pseudovibrio]|uniref:ABC transporter permease n=1 Tax=Stappiaceae TaxID=2821832 RepID=UPI0023666ED3|nr:MULTISPECIES: ABC transporter permease [Pseudovibrio]MDD7910057.1 ABC transporter permease [Pseudovibrio exalbescens]MDX5592340.1 ABC transporter permease [Pseudovibrio sp. SPO723]